MLDAAHKIANIVIAAANVVIAFFVFWQLIILQGQLTEMRSSSGQMNEAISAARDSATAAKALVGEAAVSAAAAKQSVEEALVSNKAQLRARLTAVLKQLNNISSDDSTKWKVAVLYHNAGKTPALDVDMYGRLDILEYPLPSDTKLDLLDPSQDDTESGKNVVIQPDSERHSLLIFPPGTVIKNPDRFKKGKYQLYAFGHVSYSDIYNERHYTRFCVSYPYEAILAARTGAEATGNICEQYDDAD